MLELTMQGWTPLHVAVSRKTYLKDWIEGLDDIDAEMDKQEELKYYLSNKGVCEDEAVGIRMRYCMLDVSYTGRTFSYHTPCTDWC